MKTNTILWVLIILLSGIIIWQYLDSAGEKPHKPEQTITYAQAYALEQEYVNTRLKVINAQLGIRDKREFWFSLDSLKAYLEYVEYQAHNLGYTDLGIRVYKGAYPGNAGYHDPGYSTVFFVPTGIKASPVKAGWSQTSLSTRDTRADTTDNPNIEEIDPYNFGHGGKLSLRIE